MTTKIEMAQHIITELYFLSELAPADHPKVIRRARRSYETLEHEYVLALNAAESANRTRIHFPQ